MEKALGLPHSHNNNHQGFSLQYFYSTVLNSLSGFAKMLEDYLHLEGAELFAGLDVLRSKEFGHKVGIGVNLAGEEATGDLFIIAREIEPGQILFECVT